MEKLNTHWPQFRVLVNALRFICIASLSVFLFTVCGKEPERAPDFVIFAETNNMQVSSLNSSTADVNGDGKDDLSITSESVKTGPGPSQGLRLVLQCLHGDIAIRSQVVLVKRFTLDTLLFEKTGNIVNKVHRHEESCVEGAGKLTTSFEETRFVRFIAGDFADVNQAFSSPKGTIKDTDFNLVNTSVKGDTTEIFASISKGCNNLLGDGENYFCFRITIGGVNHIGWIKINKDEPTLIKEFAIK